MSFNRDGSRLAAASADTPVGSVVDVATGAEVLSLEGHTRWNRRHRMEPERRGDRDRWRRRQRQSLRRRVRRREDRPRRRWWPGIDWDPESNRLATAGDDGTVKVWLVSEGGDRLLSTLSAHDTRSGFVDVAFSPDGNRLAAGVSGDVGAAVATIWDIGVTAGAEVGNVPAVSFHWNDVAFTPDGRYLLTPQAGGAVGVWDATTLEPVRTLGTLDRTRPE